MAVVENANNDLERSSKPVAAATVVNGGGGDPCPPQERANETPLGNGFEDHNHQPKEVVDVDVVVVVGGGKSSFGVGGAHKNNTNHDHNANNDKDDHDMSELVDILSKLNPLAEEFVPPSLANGHGGYLSNGFGYGNNFLLHPNHGNANGQTNRRKKNNYNQGKKRLNNRMNEVQREEMIRRTVYVSDIDQQVTEEQLAGLFANCGQVVDCRVCGDPNSALRFAFIEFTDEESAKAAMTLSGAVLGFYPLRVLPSKTAIAPVNPTFLPRSEDEREMCARTIYCTNIDKKITQADIRLFFETFCGEVQRMRILGDYHHLTRIAFVEFTMAESAIAALSCSGAVIGSLPIRVSPSKTPVRPRMPRFPLH